jgi:hypothetical protein
MSELKSLLFNGAEAVITVLAMMAVMLMMALGGFLFAWAVYDTVKSLTERDK